MQSLQFWMKVLSEICKFLLANSISGKPAKLFNRGRSQTEVPRLPSWVYDCLILNFLDLPQANVTSLKYLRLLQKSAQNC